MGELTATIDETSEGRFLVVRVPLEDAPKPSGSGKTLVIASSHGNKPIDVEFQGNRVFVGVNAYIRR